MRVKENLCTFASSGKLCVSIQSFILNKCAIVCSSGLPKNCGLKYDQLNCGIYTGGVCGCIGLGGFSGQLGGCIGACGGGLAVDLVDGLVVDLVVVLGLVHVLVEVEG